MNDLEKALAEIREVNELIAAKERRLDKWKPHGFSGRETLGWTAEFGPLRRCCIHHLIGCGETWFLSIGLFENRQLFSTSADDAKEEALALIEEAAMEILKAVKE